jgi:hypothetical protein
MYCSDSNKFDVIEHLTVHSFLFKWKHIQYVIAVHPKPFTDADRNLP